MVVVDEDLEGTETASVFLTSRDLEVVEEPVRIVINILDINGKLSPLHIIIILFLYTQSQYDQFQCPRNVHSNRYHSGVLSVIIHSEGRWRYNPYLYFSLKWYSQSTAHPHS